MLTVLWTLNIRVDTLDFCFIVDLTILSKHLNVHTFLYRSEIRIKSHHIPFIKKALFLIDHSVRC